MYSESEFLQIAVTFVRGKKKEEVEERKEKRKKTTKVNLPRPEVFQSLCSENVDRGNMFASFAWTYSKIRTMFPFRALQLRWPYTYRLQKLEHKINYLRVEKFINIRRRSPFST